MIDLATETLLTLEQAAERVLVHKATLFRWISHGSKGVKLEAVRMGGRWRTSEEALQRFGDRLTPDQEATPALTTQTRTTVQRRREIERAGERLDEWMGVRKCEKCRKVIDAGDVTIPKNERLWCPDCLVQRKSATLGQRIRTFRWAAKLSQQALAQKAGFGIDKLREYEYDRRKPPEDHLVMLIEVLGEKLVSGLKSQSTTTSSANGLDSTQQPSGDNQK